MQGCEEYAWMLSAFLDGELNEDERAALISHLDKCESCRGELADLGAMSALLSSEEADVPDGFSEQLFMRIRAQKRKERKHTAKWTKRLAPIAACAAVLVVVVSIVQVNELGANTTQSYAFSPAGAMMDTESAALAAEDVATENSVADAAPAEIWSEMRQKVLSDCGSAKLGASTDTACCDAPQAAYAGEETDGECSDEALFILTAARTDELAAWAEENGAYEESCGAYRIDAAQFEALSALLSCEDDWSGRYKRILLVLE